MSRYPSYPSMPKVPPGRRGRKWARGAMGAVETWGDTTVDPTMVQALPAFDRFKRFVAMGATGGRSAVDKVTQMEFVASSLNELCADMDEDGVRRCLAFVRKADQVNLCLRRAHLMHILAVFSRCLTADLAGLALDLALGKKRTGGGGGGDERSDRGEEGEEEEGMGEAGDLRVTAYSLPLSRKRPDSSAASKGPPQDPFWQEEPIARSFFELAEFLNCYTHFSFRVQNGVEEEGKVMKRMYEEGVVKTAKVEAVITSPTVVTISDMPVGGEAPSLIWLGHNLTVGQYGTRRVVGIGNDGEEKGVRVTLASPLHVNVQDGQEGEVRKVSRLSAYAYSASSLPSQGVVKVGMSGWGRRLRTHLKHFYHSKRGAKLLRYMTKSEQREGWGQMDVLRLAHISPLHRPDMQLVFHYVKKGEVLTLEEAHSKAGMEVEEDKEEEEEEREVVVEGREEGGRRGRGGVERERRISTKQLQYLRSYLEKLKEAKTVSDEDEAVRLITDKRFPIAAQQLGQSQLLRSAKVWTALLPSCGAMAVLWNLQKFLTIPSMLTPDTLDQIRAKLTDAKEVRQARLHPLRILMAMVTLKRTREGPGVSVVNELLSILDTAFEHSIDNAPPFVVPSLEEERKRGEGSYRPARIVFGVDVSGSMTSPLSGTCLTAMQAALAMSLIAVKQARRGEGEREGEDEEEGASKRRKLVCACGRMLDAIGELLDARDKRRVRILEFTDGVTDATDMPYYHPDCSMSECLRLFDREHKRFSCTDMGALIRKCITERVEADLFVMFTDCEVNMGEAPSAALREYRREVNTSAGMVVCALQMEGFTVADPADPLSLDLPGFDPSYLQLISQFLKSRGFEDEEGLELDEGMRALNLGLEIDLV
eukprot:CAMPEP_0113880354 /NCGR_PEP_ID=MMETSP0780_2-20120614/7738_1 /TAXON_ID=652834 /ORGANISM="Palpitomonas bilix" /LENGTH=875 /DNA_ID=CAMNT_0000867019 /DNA_START=19 /DNA_END=2646 /DNA_ORIENTATION=- /assembly_acc=CAM_ASM_000599